MHFRSLEIHGFKSFADKTVLDFDTRMTAVVGSNGNGKSNISDALRWVMGEQGAKTLRGEKMEDVIFHGTVTRKQMGFAKVALSIDNTDRALPVDSDEVVITRKLYRTGESEYLINGSKSRLKDIQDLLRGTGLGRDGYSIIGQGRVAEIVNAKGSQRREIFEEAAGVSKFLHRKEEAQRELARAQDNFLRLKDIESGLSERLPTLEKQSEKAKKARELMEHEKGIEIAVTVAELDVLSKSLSDTENNILINKGECDHFTREIGELEEESEELTLKKSQYAAQIDDLRRSSNTARDEIAEAEKQTAVLENEIMHARQSIDELKERIKESEKSADEFDRQIGSLKEAEKEKSSQIKETAEKIESLRRELDSGDQDNKELGEDFKELDDSTKKLYNDLTEAKITLQQAEKTKEELTVRAEEDKKRIEEQETAADEHRKKRRALTGELEKLAAERQELENKLSGYRKLYEGKNNKLSECRSELDRMKNEYNSKKQRLDVLSDVERSMTGYSSAVKNIMNARRMGKLSGIHGTVADVITVDKRYTVAVETALGAALQNIIVDNEETAKRCISYLKNSNGGRATFYPLTSVKGTALMQKGLEDEEGFEGIASELIGYAQQYEGVIRSVLGRTAVFDDINSATFVAKKYGYKFRIITLDGQIINAGGAFTGGSVKETSGIISRKQEIEALGVQTSKLSESIKTRDSEFSQLSAETAKMKIEMEGFAERINDIKREEAGLSAQADGIKELIRQCEELSDSAELIIERGKKQLAEQEALIGASEKRIAGLEEVIAANEEKLKLAGEKLETANRQRAELSEKITALNMDKLSLEKDLAALTEKRTVTEQLKLTAKDDRKRIEQDIVQRTEGIENTKKEVEVRKREAKQAKDRYGQNSAAISETVRKSDECEKRIAELSKNIKEKSYDREKFSNALAVAQEKRKNVEADIDKYNALLWNKYELTLNEARKQAGKIENLSEAQQELSSIRKKLSALGSVNFAAIEEFEEVKQRFAELSAQLTDVEGSKAELEKLIAGLTADIKAMFMSSFNDINEKFSAIFTEIFGGGEAHLELMDPENVLESGIEIFAAPPGKLIKNLISLSGGEQTMVAITIYFAILLHRPTPFCMLDEVDAALDEINVVKYVTYLKRFSARTQLMIISHRRGTIEGCDVLYGVFMQEKGISRLIHQELTDDMELDVELD